MDKEDVRRSSRIKCYYQLLVPLFIASIIAFLDRVNIGYAALTMNLDLGFGPEVFGFGAGIFFLGYVLFEIPGAIIAEKYSPRKWLVRIMVTWGLVTIWMAFVHSEREFYLVRFLLGAAEASLYPVMYASIIPRFFVPADRPKALALMLTSMQFSVIIGSPLAGWLIGVNVFGLHGWQSLFILEAIPPILFGLAIWFWLSDWPKDCKWLTRDEQRFLMDSFAAEVAAKAAVKKYTILQAFADKEVLKLCLIYFLWVTGFWGFNFWMPTVLKAISGWSNLAVGLMLVIPMLFSLLFMAWNGCSSTKTGERNKHGAYPLFLAAAAFLIGAFVTDPIISFSMIILIAVGVYGPFGVWWSYPTTFLSGPAAAGATALINSVGNIGGFTGPYAVGYIKAATGSFAGAYIYFAISLLLAGGIMLTLRQKQEKPESAASPTVVSDASSDN